MTGAVLTPTEFGRQLLTSGDLDPVYLMLQRGGLGYPTLQRWCLAYWLFYHAGVASHIAYQPSELFWEYVRGGLTDKWPRGTERRHFRGKQANKTVNCLFRDYMNAETAVDFITNGSGQFTSMHGTITPFSLIKARALTWWGFGEWISFKMADMCDSVLGCPVDFSEAIPDLFDAPKTGAHMVVAYYGGDQLNTSEKITGLADDIAVIHAINALKPELGAIPVPHAPHRVARLQEWETILCKYKSHVHGHYDVGHDTIEIRRALAWSPNPLSTALAAVLPPSSGHL